MIFCDKQSVVNVTNFENMNVNVELSAANLKKNIFTLKPIRKDGLILQLQYTSKEKDLNVRFTQSCFNNMGQVLVSITHKGDVFVVNFTQNKFWFLINICSCTVVNFLPYTESEIIAGISSGLLNIINIDRAQVVNKLIGHTCLVSEISFSTDSLCITSSTSEAIVWDLRNCNKVQVLTLSQSTILKHVLFMPVTNNILSCFHDDSIHVWKYGTFEILTQIMPASWNKFLIKTIAFTRNGRAMVLGGHSSTIAIFLTDSWHLAKIITLPNTIQGVKKLDFISQPFDGGSNRTLVILSSNGIVYFYDMELDCIASQITLDVGVCKFHTSSNGKYIACVLTSGLVNIYNLLPYVLVKSNTTTKEELKAESKTKLKVQQAQKSSSIISAVNEKFKDVLDKQKLCAILKEFGQYPDMYRLKIWSQLLELPNNKQQYNLSINYMSQTSFENLGKEYPIEDKVSLKNLKKLLANIVMWCPFFAEVYYLPVFVFPFVKVFKNEPVLCFEAVCTIIVNWCQHWFEYYPLPPINTLAMIENVLLEHDPEILSHLNKNKITSKIYAWTLLETVFSEILTSYDWLILWDHILSNEPSFILMVVVSYSIIFHHTLIKLTNLSDFEFFYHNQNLICVKKLIAKSYSLLNTTSDKKHPRQYLNYFKKLDLGPYPQFVDYPKAVVAYQNSSRELKRTSQLLESTEDQILKRREGEAKKLTEIKIGFEENLRLGELELLCKSRFNQEREIVESQRKRLEDLRRQVYDEEIEILTVSRDTLKQTNSIEKERYLKNLLFDIEQKRSLRDVTLVKAEGDLIKHYADLLKYKQQIEELLNSEQCKITSREHALLIEQQEQLVEEIEKVKNVSNSKQHLKQLNIATGLISMDNMIKKIENELEHRSKSNQNSSRSVNVKQLQLETVELELEVKKLLQLLDHVKENKYNNNSDDFSLLRTTIKKINEEYDGPPPSPI